MNFASIAHVLGKLLIVTGCSMAFPLVCSLYYGENDLVSIFISGIVTFLLGFPPVVVCFKDIMN
jgi:trk system potassium uptake protein